MKTRKPASSLKNGPRSRVATLRVVSLCATRGCLELGELTFSAALGRSGIRALKREGDGATPAGVFRIVEVLYRPDRVNRPNTPIQVSTISETDGWCDDQSDRNYNRPVRLPYPASTEHLWRNDSLYDVIVILDFNLGPRRKGLGSAIFLHVARRNFSPTAGCIALRKPDLLIFLKHLNPGAAIAVASVNRPYHRGRRGLR